MKIPEKAIVDHLKEHISDVRVDTETQFEYFLSPRRTFPAA